MKKTLCLVISLLAISIAHQVNVAASVTPTQPYIRSGPLIPSVSDANWAAMSVTADSYAQTVTIGFRSGTATIVSGHTTAFVVDPNGASLTVSYNLGTNLATSSNGLQWPLTSAEITAVNNILSSAMTAVRDPGELDAINNGVFGTGTTNSPW